MRQIPAVYVSNYLLFPPGHRARLHFPDSFEVWFLYGGIMASGMWVKITYAQLQAWLIDILPPITLHSFSFPVCSWRKILQDPEKAEPWDGRNLKKVIKKANPVGIATLDWNVSEISLCCAKPLNSWGLLQQRACPNAWNNYGLLSAGSGYM